MKIEITFRLDSYEQTVYEEKTVEIYSWDELPDILEEIEQRNTVVSISRDPSED